MITKSLLPFKLEIEKKDQGLTGLSGLPVYYELACVSGLIKKFKEHLSFLDTSQGWHSSTIAGALVLLNLAGGDCVEDIDKLEGDDGLRRIFKKAEFHDLPRKESRVAMTRFRKGKNRAFPSKSVIFRYLSKFHSSDEELFREEGKAFIPNPTRGLRGLEQVNREQIQYLQDQHPETTATLDMDATLIETHKREAQYCYKHHKAYQPLNTYWYEQGVILHTEFRDGNVPAGFDQLRVLKESLESLPTGIERVYLRSDTAGYQHDLLKYCDGGLHPRYGKITFAICCDVTESFKRAVREVPKKDWHPIYNEINGKKVESGREWAEVCFVPNKICSSKKGMDYRYLAIREVLRQPDLPGMEPQQELPFPTMTVEKTRFKLFGVVTNIHDWDGERVIKWNRERCGNSEHAHGVMKNDLAGGRFPCENFGANAAWWWIMILALNLNEMMKILALDPNWRPKRMKAIRYWLINVPGRVIKHSRQLRLRLPENHPSNELICRMRYCVAQLAAAAPG
jgi:hypothetical protein